MSEAATAASGYRRLGQDIPPQGVGGYDQNWYPVCESADLKAGEVKGVDFMDGRVIVYRGESGKAYVRSAYCRHVGADLSIGKVVGEAIRCPFHHWRYGESGKCEHIPAGDPIPESARLFAYPTVEKWGLVWAFNGTEPLFDPPHFVAPDDELAFNTVFFVELPQDHWVLLSNSCDFQHLQALHNLTIHTRPGELKEPDPYHIEGPIAFEDPKFGRMEQYTRVFGTNVLTLSGTMQGLPMCTLFAAQPVPGNGSRGWSVFATKKSDGTPEDDARVQMMLTQGEQFFRSLVEDDDPIMRIAHFRNDNLSKSDWALAQYFDYVRRYPRAHPGGEFIR